MALFFLDPFALRQFDGRAGPRINMDPVCDLRKGSKAGHAYDAFGNFFPFSF
jgi:hypothetical protein